MSAVLKQCVIRTRNGAVAGIISGCSRRVGYHHLGLKYNLYGHHHRAAVASFSSSSSIHDDDSEKFGEHLTDEQLFDLVIQQQKEQQAHGDFEEAVRREHPQEQQELPWKNLLETAARASWRVTDPPPPPNNDDDDDDSPPLQISQLMIESCQRILEDGNRSPKQLTRAYNRKILETHKQLAEYRERERRRIVNGKRKMTQTTQTQQQSPQSSATTTTTDAASNKIVYYGYEETLASLRYRLKANYAISKRVLEETKCLLAESGFQPKRIIDLGIGCGSSSVAAIDVFESQGIEWIHGIDPSQPMKDCSKKLIEGILDQQQRYQPTNPFRLTFSNTLSASETSQSSEGTFDLALMTYTATEFPDVYSALAAAAILFQKLKPNGVLVMIEPGTPDGFNSIRSVRSMLLDCCPPNASNVSGHEDEDDDEDRPREQCHIIAPCTHNGTCPMERHKRKYFKKKGKSGHDIPQKLEQTIGDDVVDDWDDEDWGDDDSDDFDDDDGNDNYESDEINSSPKKKNLLKETDSFSSSFCSFVHSLTSSDNSHNKKGEKFSYLVAQKRFVGDTDDVGETPSSSLFLSKYGNITELLKRAHTATSQEDTELAAQVYNEAQTLESKYLKVLLGEKDAGEDEEDTLGLNFLHGDRNRLSMGRIIRAPIKKKGHVYVDYCTGGGSGSSHDDDVDDDSDTEDGSDEENGRILRSRITKANSNNIAPGMYTAARKSRWGGFWPDISDSATSTSSRET